MVAACLQKYTGSNFDGSRKHHPSFCYISVHCLLFIMQMSRVIQSKNGILSPKELKRRDCATKTKVQMHRLSPEQSISFLWLSATFKQCTHWLTLLSDWLRPWTLRCDWVRPWPLHVAEWYINVLVPPWKQTFHSLHGSFSWAWKELSDWLFLIIDADCDTLTSITVQRNVSAGVWHV